MKEHKKSTISDVLNLVLLYERTESFKKYFISIVKILCGGRDLAGLYLPTKWDLNWLRYVCV